MIKVELHCHLDGSLNIDFVDEMLRKQGIVFEREELKQKLEVHPECMSLTEYLEKFVNYDHLTIDSNIAKNNAIVNVLTDVNVVIPSNDLINFEEELAKLNAQEQKLLSANGKIFENIFDIKSITFK